MIVNGQSKSCGWLTAAVATCQAVLLPMCYLQQKGPEGPISNSLILKVDLRGIEPLTS